MEEVSINNEFDALEELGEVVKEGELKYQIESEFGDWAPCHLVVRKHGLIYTPQDDKSEPIVIKLPNSSEVKIEVLPDAARRSRETKLFPFSVRPHDDGSSFNEEEDSSSGEKNVEKLPTFHIIFATLKGREMWEWATYIQWRGETPKEESIPYFYRPSTTDDQDLYYTDHNVLQDVLMVMFTYKNCPGKPLSYQEIYGAERFRSCGVSREEFDDKKKLVLEYLITEESRIEGHQVEIETASSSETLDDEDSSYEEGSDSYHEILEMPSSQLPELKQEIIDAVFPADVEYVDELCQILSSKNIFNGEYADIKNYSYHFGEFVQKAIVGACVNVHEKCFELLLSTDLYDISTTPTHEYNSPLSMLCEGDYNKFRRRMVDMLWENGYPRLKGYDGSGDTFICNIVKPDHISGIASETGRPVHPDDKNLCRYLRDVCGDGVEENEKLSCALEKACKKQAETFSSTRKNRMATAFVILEVSSTINSNIMAWGRTTLKRLDISGCSILDLPEELYEFKSLTHLNVARNCLLDLSHKLGNLTNLQSLNISSNVIEELPDTIAKLDMISEFSCSSNPISKPPSEVWERGIADVRKFFRDIRESGEELNTNLQVLVLGLSEAGKTSLINGIIDPYENALTRVGDRTIGIEKRTWTMDRHEENKPPANFLIYDFAGQQEYYVTHHLFLGSKALYILAFDLSKYTPKNLDRQILLWWDSIQNRVSNVHSKSSKTPKVIIVGTKADLVKDAKGKAADILESLKSRFHLREKRINASIDQLKKDLGKLDPRRRIARISNKHDDEKRKALTEKANLEYDQLSDQQKNEITSKEEEILKWNHQYQCAIMLPNKICAVSNKNLENFDELKAQIASSLTESSPSGKYFTHFDVPVPYNWVRVRKYVYDRSTKIGGECMELSEYLRAVSTDLNLSQDIAFRATQFLHDLGFVLFYPKHNLVFLRPSYLVDVFKLVIRHDHKEATYWKETMQGDFNISEEKFNQWKEMFLQKGQLMPDLLNVLWSPLLGNLSGKASALYDNWTALLRNFDIAAIIQQDDTKVLLIPEFLPEKISNDMVNKDIENNCYVAQRWISGDKSLPYGILKRIQVNILKNIYEKVGTNLLELAQDEFFIEDKYATALYFKVEKDAEVRPKSTSEGIRFFIQSKLSAKNVSNLLDQVNECIDHVLKEYTGLIFEFYAMHTSKRGSSFVKMTSIDTALKRKQTTVTVNLQREDSQIEQEELNIDDLVLYKSEGLSNVDVKRRKIDFSHSTNVTRHDRFSIRGELCEDASNLELPDFLKVINIDVEEREKIIRILRKGGYENSNDLLEAIDDGLDEIDALFGKEVRKKEKAQIRKWLRNMRNKS